MALEHPSGQYIHDQAGEQKIEQHTGVNERKDLKSIRPKPATGTPTETLKVFIKFHNDTVGCLEIFKPLAPTKDEEALFCYEYGRTGLGAKVYGFFKTQDGTLGRVEEFLDACNMEPEDVENPVIRADIAKGLAMFHVLKTSLEKKAVDSYYEAVINGLRHYHKMDKVEDTWERRRC
ncbi:unnamed protein product [Umbelopsis sp. WA50703]